MNVDAMASSSPDQRAERGSDVRRTTGALWRAEHLQGLAAAGATGASVDSTHEVTPGLHRAIAGASEPAESKDAMP